VQIICTGFLISAIYITQFNTQYRINKSEPTTTEIDTHPKIEHTNLTSGNEIMI